jgi:hypothetical protein
MFIATRSRKSSDSLEYSSITVHHLTTGLSIVGKRLDKKGDSETVTVSLNENELRLITKPPS